MTAPVIAVFSIAVVLEGMLQADSNQTVPITRRLRGQKGLCVLIPCNYSEPETPLPTGLVAVWYKDYDRPTNSTVYHPNQDLIDRDYKARARLSGNLSEGDCSLIIGGLQGGDNGAYRFTIEHTALNFTGGDLQIELEITDLEWKPNITYSSEIVADRSTTLDCSFVDDCRGQGPNLTWINSTLLMSSPSIKRSRGDNSTSLFSTSLTFVPSYKDNGKEVGCKAQFVLADSWSVQTLVLDVKHGPKMKKVQLDPVTEGESVEVTCIAESNPLSNVSWFRNNRRILTTVNKSLTLTLNITRQDRGYYYCRSWNGYGRAKRNISIVVNYGPRIEDMGGTVIVLEGGSFQRSCIVDSHPGSNVTWSRGDQAFGNGNSSQATLHINGMRDTDSGLYTCTAENPYGTTNRSLYITMEYAPRNLTISLPDGTPVNVSLATEEGLAFSLLCVADSDPPSNLTWLVDGRVRNSSAGSEELWLVVTNVTYQDDGEHRCLAVNSHGTLQVSVTVDLKYSPRETVVRFSGDAIKEGDEVTLTCGSKSNPPATNYSWFRADGSQRFVLVANSDSIGLGRVTRDNQTSFFCTAENTIGSSNSSLFHLSVEYKPEISPESDCARRTEGVTCVCTAIANPPGDLTWHQPFSNVSGNQTGSRFVAWQVTHGQLVTGSLTLMTGEAEEETRVACSVRNQHGEAWFNVYLANSLSIRDNCSSNRWGCGDADSVLDILSDHRALQKEGETVTYRIGRDGNIDWSADPSPDRELGVSTPFIYYPVDAHSLPDCERLVLYREFFYLFLGVAGQGPAFISHPSSPLEKEVVSLLLELLQSVW
uniref:Schwann cell myelin protein-like isoform X2 n=1 Tax=Pristiophorus japonicus TaxID=55135 RepID=UPI00398E8171